MDYNTIKTPAFVVEEELLIKNLEILNRIKQETGCHVLVSAEMFFDV